LSDPAKDYEPRLDCEHPEYTKITLRHLSNMTSGYDGEGGGYGEKDPYDGSETPFVPAAPVFPPGTMYSYWDDAMCMFGLVLTKIANGTLYDLFEERIASPIEMNPDKWDWMNWGEIDGLIVNRSEGGVNITARELARFGHLILNCGNWNGTQLISTKWLDEATRVQVPNTMKGRVDSPRQKSISARAVGTYGYHWWANGVLADGTRLFSDAPLGTFYRSGWPQQRLFVIPEWNMVIVRLGLDKHRTDRPADARACWNTVLRMVGEAISDVSSEGQLNKQQAKDKQKNLVTANRDRIKPYGKNPRYWQYKGQPVLLLGGSKDDNLFQIPDLEEHLDLLASVGGNYIRNTMSARVIKGFEVQAFKKLPNGKYDLNQWNDEYWNRFEALLKLTSRREIIIQIEVWDRFDYSDHRGWNQWHRCPYNPANNINYTPEESGLATAYPKHHPGADKQPFFHTIPKMDDNLVLRKYQEAFVDKMLSHSLPYGNVLYCMNNETSTPPAWGQYWMARIRRRATEAGVKVFVTDMFDVGWDLDTEARFLMAFDTPELYTFLDISQNNGNPNMVEKHWRNILFAHDRTKNHPRPINNVKVYGADEWPPQSNYHKRVYRRWGTQSGVRSFVMNVLGGCASTRFHRNQSNGLGLTEPAQAALKAIRKLESLLDMWEVRPDHSLLVDREPEKAFLTANRGEKYVVFLPQGGSARVNLKGSQGTFQVQWIDVSTGEWGKKDEVRGNAVVTISAPDSGSWIAAIVRL
jgi:CubicO group peptidase (beta-lactamase class C family)